MHLQSDPPRRRKIISVKSETLLLVLLVCTLGFVVSSAANANKSNSNSKAQAKIKSQAPTPSILHAPAADEDKGDFELIYGDVKDKKNLEHLEKMVKDSKLFEGIITDLNNEFALPGNVPIRFLECSLLPDTKETGVENAWYDPDDKSITICYELISRTESVFKDDETSPAELKEAVLGATAWTFFHELGHALVNIYQLPITGKEEDAVDQLSTYILVTGGDAGEKAALDGAAEFLREQEEDGDVDDIKLADSHSLDKQRFFNIICWIYGQNEEKFADLAKGKDAVLPENRADRCQAEFEQIGKSWSTLLASHFKKKADAKGGGN